MNRLFRFLRVPAFPGILLLLFFIFASVQTVCAQALVVDPGAGGQRNLGTVPVSPAMVNGNPAVAYIDDATGAAKFARATNPDGTVWSAPVVVDAASRSARPVLHVVNGNPALCYYDYGKTQMMFVRALDTQGQTWGTPVVLFSGQLRLECGMAIVDGNPAVCFVEQNSRIMKYVRALDADGAAWGTPVMIYDTTGIVWGMSMKVAQGRPAVVYADQTGLYFLRAPEISGPWTVLRLSEAPATPDFTAFVSMEIVNGNPAVCYNHQQSSRLRYRRALDPAGAAWGEPVTFTSEPDPYYCSLAVVQGKPVIGFSSGSPRTHNYLRALDADGATVAAWGPHTVVDSRRELGQGVVLHVVNDRPAITCYGLTPVNSVKYLRAVDDGSKWPSQIAWFNSRDEIYNDGAELNFSKVKQGNTSTAEFTVRVSNDGGTSYTLLGATIDGPDAAEFSISPAPQGLTVTPQQGQAFTIRHSPVTVGTKHAALHILTDAPGDLASLDLNLSGNSLPDIRIEREGGFSLQDDEILTYPITPLGQPRDFAFTVKNTGGGNLSGLTLTFGGRDSGEFSMPVPLPASLPPDETAAFTIRHTPLVEDGKITTVRIDNNVTGSRNPFEFTIRMITGSADASFRPTTEQKAGVAVAGSGRIVCRGNPAVSAFNPDGTHDVTFFSPDFSNSGDGISFTMMQKDGTILTGGEFKFLGGVPLHSLARLQANGTPDPSFAPDFDIALRGGLLQPDDKIVVWGYFTKAAGISRPYLARLNPDGSLDAGFAPAPDARVEQAFLQPDGKFLVSGIFTAIGGGPAAKCARLHADGRLDSSFTAGNKILRALQPDGKIMATDLNVPSGHLVRLLPDGTQDGTFTPAKVMGDVMIQTNGRLIVMGSFSSVDGVPRKSLARFEANGSLDLTFEPAPGANVFGLAGLSNGKLIVAGDFPHVGGISQANLARLNLEPASDLLSASSRTVVRWMRQGSSPEVNTVTFDVKSAGAAEWTRLGNAARIAGGWELTGLSLPAEGQIRAQGFAGYSLMESTAAFSFSTALDVWRQEHFGTTSNTGSAADDADPDNDGLTNFAEFAFGLPPLQRAGSELPAFEYDGGYLTTSFSAPAGAGSILLYGAEWSSALLPGTWTTIPDTGTGNDHVFRIPASGVRLFLRYSVRMR